MDAISMTKGVPAEVWADLAKAINTTPEEVQARYEAVLAGGLVPQEITVDLEELQEKNSCFEYKFSIPIYKGLVAISGKVTFCGTSIKDWSADLHICLDVLGKSVWCTDYHLSPKNPRICFSPSVGVAKASFCVELTLPKACINFSGEGCYWALGWHCAKFNVTPYCFLKK